MNFIGIDLAWKVSDTQRARTGLAVIDGTGHLIDVGLAASDDEIFTFINKHAGESCAVAIDAPLVVQNETGQRPVENLLLRRGISAYPANRSLLTRVCGGVRGEVLAGKLSARGFTLETGRPMQARRSIYEVFPSPAYRVLLGLDASVKLKRRKGIGTTDIRNGFRVAWDKIISDVLDPPLIVDDRIKNMPITGRSIEELRGRSLDQFGDVLDAILCAHIVYRYHLDPDSTLVIGDLATGYILLPAGNRKGNDVKA